MPALTWGRGSSVHSCFDLYEEVFAMQVGFEDKEIMQKERES
jgi:hypothetical protein